MLISPADYEYEETMPARTVNYAVVAMLMVAMLFLFSSTALAATYSVPGNSTTITEAIANASAGDTIVVDGGVYHEHLIVNKGLTLQGRDTGTGKPTVDAIEIWADNAIVQGFRVNGADVGIEIHGYGGARVLDCTVLNCGYGIKLNGAHGGIVMNNTVTGSQNVGIYLGDSSGNALYLNEVAGNQYGIALTGTSTNNAVYMNDLDNADANGLGNGLYNSWNASVPVTYGYGGRTFSKCLGNHWGNLRGADADGDGVLDASVMLAENNGDYNPLVEAPLDRPEADFLADYTSGTAPLAVQFTDNSSGYPVSWYWDFGDGATSDVQDPPHIYKNAGSYTVSLAVKNMHGEGRLIRSNFIVAGTAPSPAPAPTKATPEPWPSAAPTVKPTEMASPSPTPAPTPGAGWPGAVAAMAMAYMLIRRIS